MSNENISSTPLQISHGRASTPLPPKPPPPPPLKQNNSKNGSSRPFTTDDIALPSINENLSTSSPTLGTQKKPSPAPKPSRLSRAFSTGHMTFPSFLRHHKRSNTAKENGKMGKTTGKEKAVDKHQDRDTKDEKAKESTVSTETVSTTENTSITNRTQLRDAPLWKLPGLGTAQKQHSVTSLDTNDIPKPHSVPTSRELPDTPPQFSKHTPPDIPHKTATFTNRELPELPDVPPQLPKHASTPPDIPPKCTAPTAQELSEHPNTSPQLPKHSPPDLSPKPAATLQTLPETFPQLLQHQPPPKLSSAATIQELPQLPDLPPHFPTRPKNPAKLIPYSKSPPMEKIPPPDLPLRLEAPIKAASSEETIINPEDCKSSQVNEKCHLLLKQ